MSLIARGSAAAHGAPPPPARVRLGVAAARLAGRLSRLARRGEGGVIGGRVLLAVAPGAVRDLAAGRRIALVSGTNGKTTTTALLAAAMEEAGPVAGNVLGANTAAGVASALCAPPGTTTVLESDEAWLPWIAAQTRPSAVVLLNLTRDQLDRHHEVGRLAERWRAALADVSAVVANADDPNVVWAALTSGTQVWVAAGQWWHGDSRTCPRCGQALRRTDGDWSCRCGLARPTPAWSVEGDELVGSDGFRMPLQLGVPGRFNLGNAALAAAAAAQLGVPAQRALSRMRRVRAVADRYLVRDVDGRSVRLLLAKNPAGWLEALGVLQPEPTPVVLVFNANAVDGRDPSWLYDVSFTSLRNRPVVVSGERAADMGVRLLIDEVGFVESGAGVRAALAGLPPGPVDVIANYTAFQQVRQELHDAR